MAFDTDLERRPLEARELFAHVITELGVQRERAVVVARLHQADPRRALLDRPPLDVVHERATDLAVLDVRVDRDGPDPDDRRPFVEEVAADDPSVELGHDGVDPGVSEHHARESDRHLRLGEVGREVVRGGDRVERLVADAPDGLGVLGRSGAELQRHRGVNPSGRARGRGRGAPSPRRPLVLTPMVVWHHPHDLELVAVGIAAVQRLGRAVVALPDERAHLSERRAAIASSWIVGTSQARW